MFGSKKEQGTAAAPEGRVYVSAASTIAGCMTPEAPPRLEPFHSEVKDLMKHSKMTEKEAEKRVRKILLEDAAYRIQDDKTRTFALALINLL